jgi:hypothetical protein
MQTLNQPEVDHTNDSVTQDHADKLLAKREKIGGFEASRAAPLKEPSLYISLGLIFAFAAANLSSTPLLFWSVFLSMSGLAVLLHFLAERFIFSTKENDFDLPKPYEGAFLITFGAIVPAFSLLAFIGLSVVLSGYLHTNWWTAVERVALLVLVPTLNFAVWSTVKKRYLARPRLVGFMNGLALGLSSAWTIICLKCIFFSQLSPYSDLAWPFILIASPFSLVAACTLAFDLWKRTENNIGRIASTFSVIGVMLSFLFVFGPVIRPMFIQFVMQQAVNGKPDAQTKALSFLRSIGAGEELSADRNSSNDLWSMGRLFIPAADPDLYFKLTGRVDQNTATSANESLAGSVVGPRILGLSLTKSQILGNVDPATLSSSLDWTLVFHNNTKQSQEARSEITLPAGAVVSRLTLWINGQPQEGAFASTERVEAAYKWIVHQHRDPLLVTVTGTDRILVQCSPVPENGGEMKIRLGMKVPLIADGAYKCSIQLPKFMETNFAQPKRHRLRLVSKEILTSSVLEPACINDAREFVLDGIVKGEGAARQDGVISVERKTPLTAIATPDWYSHNKQFIIESFKEVSSFAPKRLFVVIDSSASLKADAPAIKEALANLPVKLDPQIYIACDRNAPLSEQGDIAPKSLAQSVIAPESFAGGQDNGPTLKEALENAAEKSGGAVLWIHGPQPIAQPVSEAGPPDLIHSLYLYDFEVQPGPNTLIRSLGVDRLGSMVSYVPVKRKSTVEADLSDLFAGWQKSTKQLIAVKTLSDNPSGVPLVSNRLISSQLTCLWAKDQVEKLLGEGQKEQAVALAASYRILTPVSGGIVMELGSDYQAQQLDPGSYKDTGTNVPGVHFQFSPSVSPRYAGAETPVASHGLIGAPVAPRYGQSNEVGMLCDYGYDTARDVSRVITFATAAICLLWTILFLRDRKKKQIGTWAVCKFIALMFVVPTVVHILGTFFINNFGGLGGGL